MAPKIVAMCVCVHTCSGSVDSRPQQKRRFFCLFYGFFVAVRIRGSGSSRLSDRNEKRKRWRDCLEGGREGENSITTMKAF